MSSEGHAPCGLQSGWGYPLFAGVEYRISRHLGVLVESKFDRAVLDVSLTPAARVKTRTRTHT